MTCKHFKESGEKFPSNMAPVIHIDKSRIEKQPHELSYTIYQCKECGVRSFKCLFSCHLNDDIRYTIDRFIQYETSLEFLQGFLKAHGCQYQVEKEQPNHAMYFMTKINEIYDACSVLRIKTYKAERKAFFWMILALVISLSYTAILSILYDLL